MKILQHTLGLFFLIFGVSKIIPIAGFGYGFEGTVWFVGEAMGYPMATSIVVIAIMMEVLLGLSLLIPQLNGLCYKRQRVAAYGLGLFTIAATIMFHMPGLNSEAFNQELTNILKNIVIVAGLFAIGNVIEDETDSKT